MTTAEIKEHAADVRQAMLKELTSWIKHSGAKPVRIADYTTRTHRNPITSRWILNFKFKSGTRIVKARLVLRGFQEQGADQLHTSSPTATRASHRLIYHTAARRGWDIWSIDVSAAFLRGFKIEDLPTIGMNRPPVAFLAPVLSNGRNRP